MILFKQTPFSLVFCLLFASFSLQATSEVELSYAVHFDSSDTVSTEKFKAISFEAETDLSLGFYAGSIWIKAEVKNMGPDNTFILYTHDYFQRSYRFYEIVGDSLQHLPYAAFNSTSSDDRYFNFREPNFRLDLRQGETKFVLVHILSDGRVVSATPQVTTLNEYIAMMRQITIFNVVFFGFVGFFFLLNLMLAKIQNNRIYLLYGMSIFFNTYFMLGFDGSLYDIGMDNFLVDHLIFISIRLWVITFLAFSSLFLGIKQAFPNRYRWGKIFVLSITGGFTLYQLVFFHSSIPVLHKVENILGYLWIALLVLGVFLTPKTKRKQRTSYLVVLSIFVLVMVFALSSSHEANFLLSPSSLYKAGSLFDFFGFTTIMILYFGKRQKENIQSLEDLKHHKVENERRLASSNERLDRLEARIKELNAQSEANPSTPSFDITNLLAIFELLKSNISQEEGWLHFKEEFLRLDPQFLSKLVERNPMLSKSEIRLLILMKIGYTQKEIAQLLAISPESVKKAKQRTRKKLGLPPELTTMEYLRSL